MAEHFGWNVNGLNRARFEALAKLLRLRYRGQVEAPTRFDDEEHLRSPGNDNVDLEFDDADSTAAATLADFNTSKLQNVFLDRLAELVANEKGGCHVSATLMMTSHDQIRLFVARNSKFRPKDEVFLARLEALLQRIAEDQDPNNRDELWSLVLKHYEARIHDYICNLRQILKRYRQGQQWESASQLAGHLRVLHDAAFAEHASNAERNEALVTQAQRLYRGFSANDFSMLWPSGAQNLQTCLGFLGRVGTSFRVLVRAAERLTGMAQISIRPVSGPAACKVSSSERGQNWGLRRLFEHLGYPFTDDVVGSLLAVQGKQTRWSKHKLAQEFDKLKSATWEVHAEMQLLPLYIDPSLTQSAGFSAVDYIGCSKKSCFLCWHFLTLFGRVQTRGSHGKLYSLWQLPSFQTGPMGQADRIKEAVARLESLMIAELTSLDAAVLPQAKESTLGGSTTNTIMHGPNTRSANSRISSYLENQRAGVLGKALGVEKKAPYHDEVAAEDQPIPEAVAMSGRCRAFDCEKQTTRRCSHCSGAWFCSIPCEEEEADSHLFACNRRPITTADLLRRDCLYDTCPEDPQVREDYGFQRCRNRREETKLFGLYVGVFNCGLIPAPEVHRWMTEGILTEKIIVLFSAMPEQSRGGYYTWFLQNRHVLDTSKNVVRDEDDVDAYIQQRCREARSYLDSADQNKPIEQLTSWAKQNCFFMLAILLDDKYPPPEMKHLDLWFDFGYATCSNLYEENDLTRLYQRLLLGNKPAQDHFLSLGMQDKFTFPDIPTCSFEEFWTAWQDGSLVALLERYKVVKNLDPRNPLVEFLAYRGGDPSRPSVWRLRHFLAIDDANVLTVAPLIADAAVEYGFRAEMDVRTGMALREFYGKLFKRVPASLVHKARRAGLLHKVPEWIGIGDVDERVERVLAGLAGDVLEVEVLSQIEEVVGSVGRFGDSRGSDGNGDTDTNKGWACVIM